MELRGFLPYDTLKNYDVVIWSTPFWGYLGVEYCDGWVCEPQYMALEKYLESGGRLFITGQEIAWVSNWVLPDFLRYYLHSEFTGEYCPWSTFNVTGVSGDPITDGLTMEVNGEGGAMNQWCPDVIKPADPYAVPIFYYDLGGIGGVRVTTPKYNVVFLSFGFEGISNATDRVELMNRVLSWLAPDTFIFGTVETNHLWTSYTYSTPFSKTPIVLATIQTERGIQPCLPDLRNPSQTGFEVVPDAAAG
jgi:hypothetical protein